MRTINLTQNGLPFNPLTYDSLDILEALIVDGNDVVSIRVDSEINWTSIELISNSKTVSKDFAEFVKDFEENYDATAYLLETYQEYIYPFFRDGGFVGCVGTLLDYTYHHLKDGLIHIVLENNIYESINVHGNAEGAIIDYLDKYEEVVKSDTYWYQDWDETPIVQFPTACGVTKANRPNITLEDIKTQKPYTLWFHQDMKSKADALELLSNTFEKGIQDHEINNGHWLSFSQMQNQK